MCRFLESLALLVAIALFRGCTAKEITYRTVEQRPRGTFIGNIKTSANFEQTLPPEEFKTIRFSFLPKDDPSSKFLRIKETTGEIFSNIPLDREKICDPSDTNCLVRFRVSVLSDSRSTFKVVHINIYIEDINDKYPIFPQSYVKLEIPENTKDSYEIRSAVDNDAGENSIQSYTLEPIDGPFELREVQQPGGNTKLSVVVKDMLDRETKDSYKVRVVARDGGSPMRTGEVLLDISVLDVNDHPPKFTKMEYRVSKAENASVGSSVVQVRADDADIGDNGRVTYHFVGRSSSVFSLNKTSGLVILEQSLDFEAQSQYRLTVEARDLGTPSQTSQALIVVTVLDVNDDHPRITFNLLSQDGYAEVPEDAIPGTFVAHVSVADGDSGINGEVSCRLDTDTFKLQKLDSSDFQVKLNAQLDREARDEYKVTMFCRDGGDPSLTASEVFTVKVKDVNDHSPLFLQTVYSVTIEENNKIGASLVRVSATDDDIGDNGKVFYELDIKARDQFQVDRKTGRITAQTRLDREKNPEIVFNVMAKDRGNPRRADSATVSVKVLDVNDERPIFEQSEYEFFVEEGMQPGTIVDSVYAMDFDSGLGGEVIYFILPQSDPQNLFSVSTTEGTIKLNQELDREVSPQHTFILRARDKGTPSLNTTVQVTVLVGDRNDNSPVFTFPSGLNNTVEILHSLRRNSLITTIQTYDLDEGRNALTSYRIEEGNSRGLFSLDEVSGALTVRKTMKKKDSGNYALLLVAQDMGVNGQITRKLLHVKVIQDNNTAIVPVGGGDSNHGFNATGLSNPEKASSEDDSNTMMIIVICVVVATVIISVVLIASICLVLRKRSSRRPEYFMKSEEQKIMKQKESPSSSLSGKIAPPSSPNQSDDHKLGKKEVSFSLEEVPQNPHNLTNSTHNTSFSTFKGQQSSSGTPSPTEHQLPLSVRTDGSGHSTPAGHSPVTEPAPAPAPAPSPHPQPNQHPMLPHKDQHWPQKRTVEVKHLLELLHKDDTHSDTSGETFTSDSGRGGSEDDSHCPRGQHYTPADPNHPKYYATKYTPPDGSLPRRKDMTRRAGSPNGGYTRFKSSGCPVPRLDLVSREDGDAIRCSSFRQPNYTTFKSATLPGVSSSPLASPLSCGSGCNLVSAVGDGNYQNVGPAVQSHSLERAKQHSPMFKVKAPGWEPISTNLGYPPPPYPDVVNSHDFNFDEGIGDSMAYCSRDDDETTTSGSYTVNQDDLCDDVNQLYFTDVVV